MQTLRPDPGHALSPFDRNCDNSKACTMPTQTDKVAAEDLDETRTRTEHRRSYGVLGSVRDSLYSRDNETDQDELLQVTDDRIFASSCVFELRTYCATKKNGII